MTDPALVMPLTLIVLGAAAILFVAIGIAVYRNR